MGSSDCRVSFRHAGSIESRAETFRANCNSWGDLLGPSVHDFWSSQANRESIAPALTIGFQASGPQGRRGQFPQLSAVLHGLFTGLYRCFFRCLTADFAADLPGNDGSLPGLAGPSPPLRAGALYGLKKFARVGVGERAPSSTARRERGGRCPGARGVRVRPPRARRAHLNWRPLFPPLFPVSPRARVGVK